MTQETTYEELPPLESSSAFQPILKTDSEMTEIFDKLNRIPSLYMEDGTKVDVIIPNPDNTIDIVANDSILLTIPKNCSVHFRTRFVEITVTDSSLFETTTLLYRGN